MKSPARSLGTALLLLSACAAPIDPQAGASDCTAVGDGKCDGVGAHTALGLQLAGRADPIAGWLRSHVRAPDDLVPCESGRCAVAPGDFDRIWSDLNEAQGCAPSGQQSYVVSDDVLSPGKPFPRLIGVTCGDDVAGKAADVFVSAPFANAQGSDIDPRRLEMFAWDEPAQVYRFYATAGAGAGMAVEVEPKRCQGCHQGPVDLPSDRTHMMPIMNELTLPWPHWSASPDFASRDLAVPAIVQHAPSYSSLASAARLRAAPRFQDLLVRSAIDRVTRARALDRSLPASVAVGMGLLEPLFCDEQVNYVSEDGAAISTTALFDTDALRVVYDFLELPGAWAWLSAPSQVSLPPRGADPAEAFMVPVRGKTGIDLETRLIALGVLSPTDAMRIHALDWKRPVISTFRCGLWQAANRRLSAADTLGARTTGELVPRLVQEIMQVDGRSLIPEGDAALVIADAQQTPPGASLIANATTSCAQGVCLADANAFGEILEAELRSYDQTSSARARITALRDARVRYLLASVPDATGTPSQRFKAAPSLPGVQR